jgi:hypothetical protein
MMGRRRPSSNGHRHHASTRRQPRQGPGASRRARCSARLADGAGTRRPGPAEEEAGFIIRHLNERLRRRLSCLR